VRAGRRTTARALGFGLLVCAAVAHADFKDDYAHGVRAFEDGHYDEARKLLQDALSAHAEPAARMRLYGQIFKPYVPQHYLGLIALKQGDCTAMRSQWGSSENRQIILQLPEIASEEERAGVGCGGKLATNEKPPELPKPTENPPTKPTENPPAKPTEIPPPAKPVENPPAKPAENPPAKPPVVPPPKPPEKPVEKPVEKPPVAEKAEPPKPLVEAFDNYLAGRYAEVTRINPDTYADPRARFHAYLVRAAAKYTQARLAADDVLLTGAKADAAAARALDGRSVPDATLFSPAFREFYQQAH